MKTNLKLVCALTAVLVFSGAGCYSFRGGRLEFSTVAIPVADNISGEYRLPDMVTASMIAAVNNDGRVKISDPGRSEALLEITITGYTRNAYQYTSQEQVNQYRAAISAKARLKTASDRTLWQSEGISGWYVHPAGEAEEEGMKKAADNLAAEIIRQCFESW
jgi:hypothetical protein